MAELKNEKAALFWRKFCQENEIDPENPHQVWFFGNDQEMAIELAHLVISGKKKATASLVTVNQMKPEIAPIIDGYSVVTDFAGEPLCVIRTIEIRHLPFEEVDGEFAFDEGEGDQTLEDWRDGHWRYFTREAAELGIEFNQQSLICCERFRLLFPKA